MYNSAQKKYSDPIVVSSVIISNITDQKSAIGSDFHRMFNVTKCSDRRRFICQMPAFSQVISYITIVAHSSIKFELMFQDQLSNGGVIVAEEEVKATNDENDELTAEC